MYKVGDIYQSNIQEDILVQVISIEDFVCIQSPHTEDEGRKYSIQRMYLDSWENITPEGGEFTPITIDHGRCSCDLYSVIMVTGCKCNGK